MTGGFWKFIGDGCCLGQISPTLLAFICSPFPDRRTDMLIKDAGFSSVAQTRCCKEPKYHINPPSKFAPLCFQKMWDWPYQFYPTVRYYWLPEPKDTLYVKILPGTNCPCPKVEPWEIWWRSLSPLTSGELPPNESFIKWHKMDVLKVLSFRKKLHSNEIHPIHYKVILLHPKENFNG